MRRLRAPPRLRRSFTPAPSDAGTDSTMVCSFLFSCDSPCVHAGREARAVRALATDYEFRSTSPGAASPAFRASSDQDPAPLAARISNPPAIARFFINRMCCIWSGAL